jgi:hypothetical protein
VSHASVPEPHPALRAARVRRLVTVIDETLTESGREVSPVNRKVAVAATFPNPFAGRFVEDLTPLFELSGSVGEVLTHLAMEALGAPVETYGKAALVGVDGEIEHAHALLHTKLGLVMRQVLGGGKALIPCAAKRAGPGGVVDVPIHYVDAATLNSHYDGIQVSIPDAPGPDELVLVVALGSGPRPFARLGALPKEAIQGEDRYAWSGGGVFTPEGRPRRTSE